MMAKPSFLLGICTYIAVEPLSVVVAIIMTIIITIIITLLSS